MKNYSGIYTALVTPFRNNEIDEFALKNLVEWQINSGVNGLVLCATTGEAPTITMSECKQILNIVQNVNNGRVKIIVGVSSNNTENVIEKIKEFSCLSDCALVSAPYYSKPSQEGIYLHFKYICDKTNFPIMVYDVPSRCAVNITDETMLRIMKLPNIVAIKDATNNVIRPIVLRHPEIAILSGDDITSLAYYVSGGDGTISVTSNAFPLKCVQLYNAFINDRIREAMYINQSLCTFNTNMFIETNPIPIKYALSLLKDYVISEYRLPLTQPTESTKNIIKNSFKKIIETVQ